MDFGILSKSWNGAVSQNKYLLVSNAVMAIVIAMLVMALQEKRERVVLVPPGLHSQVEVGWDSASREYYDGWVYYLARLIGGITPTNLDFTLKNLKLYLDEPIYIQVQQQLLALSKEYSFKNSTAMSWFEPVGGIKYEKETDKFFISGNLQSSTVSKIPGGRTSVVYEFKLEMRAGLPVVTHFDSYEGLEPRTLKWMEEHKKALDRIDEQQKVSQ